MTARRATLWTRLTGVLTLAAVYAALLAGIVPLAIPHPVTRPLRLALAGCVVVCVLLWTLASVKAPPVPPVPPVPLDKGRRDARRYVLPRTGRFLRALLVLTVPLASGAALIQGVGPDGADGRWQTEVYAAGGGIQALPIDRLLGDPVPTGVNINDVDQYATDVQITVPFTDGPRSVTVHRAKTRGEPAEGDTVDMLYAPDRPALGARFNDSGYMSRGFALLWILVLTFCACLFTVATFSAVAPESLNCRRFRPRLHGVWALLAVLSIGLLLPGLFFLVSSGVGWLLALTAAALPWLALTWTLKQE
ncbi:hypothetical protein AB0D49_29130 [Streptomyces sp. NPDC048290]|uniref:hypothetical protein n=1 Tax=Streptomyces sp. NPDC048290 TaxID=3155811 RepID=UPI003438C216